MRGFPDSSLSMIFQCRYVYQYQNYNEGDCDIQYSRCLKYKKDDGAKIGTFFYLCKRYGVNYE